MNSKITKKIIAVCLTFTMLFSTTAVAFADSSCKESQDNDIITDSGDEEVINGDSKGDSWSNWSVKSTYKTSKRIEDMANNALFSLLTCDLKGIAKYSAKVVAAIIKHKQKGDNLYFTTTVYHRTDGTGRYQLYSSRKIYEDKARTKYITTVTTDPKTYNSTVKSIS